MQKVAPLDLTNYHENISDCSLILHLTGKATYICKRLATGGGILGSLFLVLLATAAYRVYGAHGKGKGE